VRTGVSTVARRFLPAPPLPPGRPRLVVTGFMGTGKTVAGALAAHRLGLPFFDLDRALEGRAGRSIDELFRLTGEPGFRALERDVLRDAARLSGVVIATGGGAVLSGPEFEQLAAGAVVAVLTCDAERLLARLGPAADRPMLASAPADRIGAILQDRAPLYARAGLALDTSTRSPGQVAAELAGRYGTAAGSGPARIDIEVPDGRTRVLVGEGVALQVARQLRELVPGVAAAAVCFDPSVGALAEQVARQLSGHGLRASRCALPSGEAAKSFEVVAGLWERFRAERVEPADVVVAVGGGATLDAAGFAAATYARGVACVNVPTTLLAMVDASLGGKVALNHAGTKNLAGAFHHPSLVLADPSVLATLSRRTFRAGMAEAAKALALASPLGFDALLEIDAPQHISWVVEQAIRIKAAYVEADPRDRLLRHSLNLGHTFAHALESASDHAIPHGEAVAIGMVAAARLGERFGISPEGLAAKTTTLLGALGLPVAPPPGLSRERLVEAMLGDKKRRGGRGAFVVPVPGGVELVEGVDTREALDVLEGAP